MAFRNALAALLGSCGALLVGLATDDGARAQARESSFPTARLEPLRYEPKLSPDTLLDYRPQLAGELARIPPASAETLPRLVALLRRFQAVARTSPGRWIDGMVHLGANRREYRPSDAELLAAEAGDRIRVWLSVDRTGDRAKALARAGLGRAEIDYVRFQIRHADVIGSGRYFYCSPPKPARISMRPR